LNDLIPTNGESRRAETLTLSRVLARDDINTRATVQTNDLLATLGELVTECNLLVAHALAIHAVAVPTVLVSALVFELFAIVALVFGVVAVDALESLSF
jgi:hypothetical protein